MPRPAPESEPYWEGGEAAKLDDAALRRLRAILVSAVAALSALPRRDLAWSRDPGRGRVFSYVVYHRVYHPAFAQEVPYAVAVVELDEGPRMFSNVIGIPPDKVACDMRGARGVRRRDAGRHAAEVRPGLTFVTTGGKGGRA